MAASLCSISWTSDTPVSLMEEFTFDFQLELKEFKTLLSNGCVQVLV